jgi:hypothetical protein
MIFCGLVYEIGGDLEAHRVPVEAGIVFSHRFSPTIEGRLFRKDTGYRGFLAASLGKVDAEGITHVAIADIADFYPRLYHHPLENALDAATDKHLHVRAIMKLIGGWTERVSYGIPIGSDPARLLAEVAIADVDEALQAADLSFVRYSDDFRFFTTSQAEAYAAIALLANHLYTSHGLTLQPQKTLILTTEEFKGAYVRSAEDEELGNIREQFEVFAAQIGLGTLYEPFEYEDLENEQKAFVDALNLVDMLREELEDENGPELPIVTFALRRLRQLGTPDAVDLVLNHVGILYPVLPDVIRYLSGVRGLLPARRAAVGRRVLDLLDNSILSELDYFRMWALELFSRSNRWDCVDRLTPLLGVLPDHFSRRKLTIAMGRAGQHHWFHARRRNLFDDGHWQRRAFLLGASCMEGDASDHWYRSVSPRLDVLDNAVIAWAREDPLRQDAAAAAPDAQV